MNICDVSELSGLPIKTIRYFEDIGLVPPARRESGYRAFARFDQRLAELKALSTTLSDLVERCEGDGRPDCLIIEDLARDDIRVGKDAQLTETRDGPAGSSVAAVPYRVQ